MNDKRVDTATGERKRFSWAAKAAIADICNAEDKEHADAAIKAFAKQYAAKFSKAAAETCRRRGRAAGVR